MCEKEHIIHSYKWEVGIFHDISVNLDKSWGLVMFTVHDRNPENINFCSLAPSQRFLFCYSLSHNLTQS